MENLGAHVSRHGLDQHGIEGGDRAYWNLSPARLYEEALAPNAAELVERAPGLDDPGPVNAELRHVASPFSVLTFRRAPARAARRQMAEHGAARVKRLGARPGRADRLTRSFS